MLTRERILFIVKKCYAYEGEREISRGLLVSARLVAQMLIGEGFDAVVADAVDGNSIDRLIARYRPTRVVIEAIWVTPAKMAELVSLWPNVKYTVRVHSELPFLANEGVAMDWLMGYLEAGVRVAFNASRTAIDFGLLGPAEWLPNTYRAEGLWTRRAPIDLLGSVNVGCFGAIRPLKNQLQQAAAAVRCAGEIGRGLVFHMNGSRLEQFGQNNLRNIATFLRAAGASLRLHPWLEHAQFLELVRQMDICLQVSLTESFCIVAADAVSQCVPLVGSPAIEWLPARAQADPLSTESIVAVMRKAGRRQVADNRDALAGQMKTSLRAWVKWLSLGE